MRPKVNFPQNLLKHNDVIMWIMEIKQCAAETHIYAVWPQSFCVNCFKTRYSGSNTIVNYDYILTNESYNRLYIFQLFNGIMGFHCTQEIKPK